MRGFKVFEQLWLEVIRAADKYSLAANLSLSLLTVGGHERIFISRHEGRNNKEILIEQDVVTLQTVS